MGLRKVQSIHYCRWIRAFRHYCEQRELEDLAELTAVGCLHFSQSYAPWPPGFCGRSSPLYQDRRYARGEVAMSASGIKISPWGSIAPTPAGASALIVQFLEYRVFMKEFLRQPFATIELGARHF